MTVTSFTISWHHPTRPRPRWRRGPIRCRWPPQPRARLSREPPVSPAISRLPPLIVPANRSAPVDCPGPAAALRCRHGARGPPSVVGASGRSRPPVASATGQSRRGDASTSAWDELQATLVMGTTLPSAPGVEGLAGRAGMPRRPATSAPNQPGTQADGQRQPRPGRHEARTSSQLDRVLPREPTPAKPE